MGALKFGNNPLTIRWYLLNALNTTTLLHILHQIDARKYKNAMPKSRQNNSSFLSVVG